MTATQRNPVFWLMWILPGSAVLGGFATLALAMQDADRALPDLYHWEGERLDADFARAREAARLGLRAELHFAAGQCELTLNDAKAPALQLALTSGSEVARDQRVSLRRGADGLYRGACQPLTPGSWRVALQDEAGTWAIRAQLGAQPGPRAGSFEQVELRARAPEGAGA